MLVLTGMFMEMKPETMALPVMLLIEVIIPVSETQVGDNVSPLNR